jgi:hypothetical protein
MSSSTTTRKILERLGFSSTTVNYLMGTYGINSLDDIAYLDGVDDVDTTIKVVTNPAGKVTTGKGVTAATSRNNGIPVSIMAVANLKLCVYYLKHMERVQRKPVANSFNFVLVCIYRNQQRHEVSFKKTAEALRPDIEVKPEAEEPAEGYENVDQEMTARASHTGRSFVNDRGKVWDIMSNICGKHSFFVYSKPALRTRNRREAYMLLFGHFLGPNNVGNMASVAETKLTGTL